MLAYPHFNDKFVMHADASARQLGAVITQHDRPIAFYNKKISVSQQKCTVTDLKLLSIIMTIRKFRSMLLGQDTLTCTDHKNIKSNLAYLTSQMGLQWRLLTEDHDIKIKYVKGENNQVACALHQIEFTPYKSNSNDSIDMLFGLSHTQVT